MKKLISILILALALTLALSACGKDGAEPCKHKYDNDTDTECNVCREKRELVGTSVGNICPDISVDLVGSDDEFDVQKEISNGKVVVLNFWFNTCGPCLRELPHFYKVANDYSEEVSIIAVHIQQYGVDVVDFIENESGHPEWNDGSMKIGWDTGNKYVKLFGFSAFPNTVIVNSDGVITDNILGALTEEQLIEAIEKALNS